MHFILAIIALYFSSSPGGGREGAVCVFVSRING